MAVDNLALPVNSLTRLTKVLPWNPMASASTGMVWRLVYRKIVIIGYRKIDGIRPSWFCMYGVVRIPIPIIERRVNAEDWILLYLMSFFRNALFENFQKLHYG